MRAGGGEGNVFSVGNEAIICDGDPGREGRRPETFCGGGWRSRPPEGSELSQGRANGGGGEVWGGEEVCLCILRGDQREAYPQVKGKRGVGSSQEKG